MNHNLACSMIRAYVPYLKKSKNDNNLPIDDVDSLAVLLFLRHSSIPFEVFYAQSFSLVDSTVRLNSFKAVTKHFNIDDSLNSLQKSDCHAFSRFIQNSIRTPNSEIEDVLNCFENLLKNKDEYCFGKSVSSLDYLLFSFISIRITVSVELRGKMKSYFENMLKTVGEPAEIEINTKSIYLRRIQEIDFKGYLKSWIEYISSDEQQLDPKAKEARRNELYSNVFLGAGMGLILLYSYHRGLIQTK